MRKETKGEEKNVNKFGDAVDIGVVFEDSDLYRRIDFQGLWSEEIQEETGDSENDGSLIHDTNMLIMQSEKAESEIDEIEVSEKKSTREIKVLEKKSTGEMMAESVASFVIADKEHTSTKKISPWAQLKALKADLALK